MMYYSGKERADKDSGNYYSIPSSPSMTEATTKKKMFARKPANAIGNLVPDKKKTTFEESLDALTLVRPPNETFRATGKPSEQGDWKQRDRASEVGREGPVRTEGSIGKYRQVFYSPKSQKTLLGNTSGIFQRKPSKNHTDFKPKDISMRSTIGFGREKTTAFDVSMESEDFRKNWKLKTNSSQSFISPAKPNEPRRSSDRSIQESSLVGECGYCLTHRKRADILGEKCVKLQEHYNAKVQALKDLTGKYDGVVREKTQLWLKLQRAIEGLHVKQQQLFRVREQLTHRMESYKKDVMRLTENMKYNEMEKSMLLRFKNDFGLLSKECEQLKYENDQFRKQLIAQANREHGYSFNKRHQGTPEQTPHFAKKGQPQSNIYFDCEDDSVSLNFSEHSCDYP